MIKANFTQKEKAIISKAANIELQYLTHIAGNRDEITQIGNIIQNTEKVKLVIPDEKLEIAITISNLIELFEGLEKDPNALFNLQVQHIDILALILAEHFEDIWDNEDEDDDYIEFAALCHKILKIGDLLNENPINPN